MRVILPHKKKKTIEETASATTSVTFDSNHLIGVAPIVQDTIAIATATATTATTTAAEVTKKKSNNKQQSEIELLRKGEQKTKKNHHLGNCYDSNHSTQIAAGEAQQPTGFNSTSSPSCTSSAGNSSISSSKNHNTAAFITFKLDQTGTKSPSIFTGTAATTTTESAFVPGKTTETNSNRSSTYSSAAASSRKSQFPTKTAAKATLTAAVIDHKQSVVQKGKEEGHIFQSHFHPTITTKHSPSSATLTAPTAKVEVASSSSSSSSSFQKKNISSADRIITEGKKRKSSSHTTTASSSSSSSSSSRSTSSKSTTGFVSVPVSDQLKIDCTTSFTSRTPKKQKNNYRCGKKPTPSSSTHNNKMPPLKPREEEEGERGIEDNVDTGMDASARDELNPAEEDDNQNSTHNMIQIHDHRHHSESKISSLSLATTPSKPRQSIKDDRNNNRNITATTTTTMGEFEQKLKERGFELVEQDGDGNCLFRAVSVQVYGDANAHLDVRKRCMDFMAKDVEHFSQFVDGEPFHDYIRRKRRNGVHGNNPEIQAISELYNRPVEIYVPENGQYPINIFHADYKTCDAPIRLSYHDGEHYNAVIDPLTPTAGLGLGLPGLEPGLADRMQVQKAVDESDKLHVQKIAEEAYDMDMQRVMMESKMNYIKESEGSLKQSSWNNNSHNRGSGDHRWRQQRSRSPNYNSFSSTSSITNNNASSSSSHVASLPTVAVPSSAAAARNYEEEIPAHLLRQDSSDEYPQTVQELVMNGFELQKVLKAYDLIGDNFDDLLAFLMSAGN